MKDLRQITVIGLGLLGGSIGLTILRCFSSVRVIGYTHRSSTRKKARDIAVASEVVDDLRTSVINSDIIILATPIHTFEHIFGDIADALSPRAIVTDVGSTKVLAHRWAKKHLPRNVHYVGSHPIAGSEQRGVEFARDDLFEQADCIVTKNKDTDKQAAAAIVKFWQPMGCRVRTMSPAEHDRIFANVSHLPHIAAAAILNANDKEQLKYAGKGFIDTTRVASGPPNIWADIFMSNITNCVSSINKLQKELERFKTAIDKSQHDKVEKLLISARNKRTSLIKQKLIRKELLP